MQDAERQMLALCVRGSQLSLLQQEVVRPRTMSHAATLISAALDAAPDAAPLTGAAASAAAALQLLHGYGQFNRYAVQSGLAKPGVCPRILPGTACRSDEPQQNQAATAAVSTTRRSVQV